MSHDVSLDGYPPSPKPERLLIMQAGGWAFAQHYGLDLKGQAGHSIIAADEIIDVLTYVESPNLLLTVGQPYSEIVVMATLDRQKGICRLAGWDYTEDIRGQFYPPKIYGGRLCNYIHASRLQHMSLLETLLGLSADG